MDDLRQRLWNYTAEPECNQQLALLDNGAHAIILEQYKIYVEMADRASSRRSFANTFFLTLNTAIFGVMAHILQSGIPAATSWALIFPLLAIVGQCAAWFLIIRSYRQLNSAKYKVIGALEERLPASPYWRAEWYTLGEGSDRAKYWPLTHLEQWMPVFFGALYVSAFIALQAS